MAAEKAAHEESMRLEKEAHERAMAE